MGMFDVFKRADINQGIEKFRSTKGAVLLDVRTTEEVLEYRIGGSLNIPLDRIGDVERKIPDKTTPIFVHCHSGARSGQAVNYLKQIGYENVLNIGGIMDYTGKKERG